MARKWDELNWIVQGKQQAIAIIIAVGMKGRGGARRGEAMGKLLSECSVEAGSRLMVEKERHGKPGGWRFGMWSLAKAKESSLLTLGMYMISKSNPETKDGLVCIRSKKVAGGSRNKTVG